MSSPNQWHIVILSIYCAWKQNDRYVLIIVNFIHFAKICFASYTVNNFTWELKVYAKLTLTEYNL